MTSSPGWWHVVPFLHLRLFLLPFVVLFPSPNFSLFAPSRFFCLHLSLDKFALGFPLLVSGRPFDCALLSELVLLFAVEGVTFLVSC